MSSSALHTQIGTLRQLELLLAVHEHGSIKGASESLHLTQPTVSMQLKKLMQATDTLLYEHIGRKLIFTEAGLAVVAAAKDVISRFDQLGMELADLRGLKSGILKIAVVTTSQYFIPHLLGPFCEQYPGISVRFKVGNRQQIIDRLKAAQDDFYVFSHPPQLEGLAQLEFLPNPLVAIAHKNHRLARAEKLDITSLLNEPFLMREFGSGTRHAIENFMKKLSLPLAPKMTIESNEAIKHAVMANLGISILSTHTLDFAQDNDLAILDVTQLPISSRWYFLWLEQKTVSPIAKTFLDYVTDEGRHHLLKKLSTC